jgi:hypothetical protein
MVNSMNSSTMVSLGRWLALDTPLQKLAAAASVSLILLLVSAFMYMEQADTYDVPHVVAVLRQLVYETPFQPLFLFVALVPIYLATARTSSRVGLISGMLLMTASLLPFARFEVTDPVAGTITLTEGFQNSLFQLAGSGHEMPQFVAAVTLLMMGGVVAMFWQPRIGGIIGLMGVISLAFVWNAVLDDPPFENGVQKIIFTDSNLLYGYYLAWAGAALALLGEWMITGYRRYRYTYYYFDPCRR